MPQWKKNRAEKSAPDKRSASGREGVSHQAGGGLVNLLYPVCYRMGIRTMRVWHQVRRTLKKLFAPWRRSLVRFWNQAIWQHVRHWGEEWKNFLLSFPRTFRQIREAWRRHPLEGIWRAVTAPFRGVHRFRHGLMTLLNLLAPIAAAYAMIVCVRYWGHATFALKLEYMGEPIGYIADEAVFDAAATLAEGRISKAKDVTFTVDRTPTMTMTLAQEDTLLTETELCDRILQSHNDEVARLTGVYVEDRFIGTVASVQKAQALLQALLDSHRSNTYDSDEVSFVQNVELVDGLYPTETEMTMAGLKEALTDRSATEEHYTVKKGDTLASVAEQFGLTSRQLVLLNDGLSASSMTPGTELVVCEPYGYLDVQVVRIEKIEEAIPFETETVYDTTRFIGDNYMKIYGENGIRTYTNRVSYVDGVEIGRESVSVEVTKNPVTQVYAIGAYKVDGNAQAGVATGQFTWPAPGCYNVSYGWYGYAGHRGVDILGPYGSDILAADGGVVVDANYSNWYGQGWGYYVLIDHGNGYMTRYAHLSSVLVSYGEYVTKGQLIGRMGETGRAYGVHLHFEVYSGGVRVDPWPFLP